MAANEIREQAQTTQVLSLLSLVQTIYAKGLISHFMDILSSRMVSKTQHSAANVTA
jgi:hypothetical protein